MEKMSIIIPFLNEGYKVRHTVKSIRDTQTIDHEIILLDDVSEDGYDYEAVAKEYNCRFELNPQRLGVAEARTKGVSIASHNYIILFDAHMTLPEYDWDKRIYDTISKDDRAIYCTKIHVLDEEGKEYPNTDHRAQGSHFYFEKTGEGEYLNNKWSTWHETRNKTSYIPCILGATYCFHKDYFNKLSGLIGLKQYGSDEQFLSIKCWLEGGTVKLINDVKIGHWFRDRHPYSVSWHNTIYNKLFIVDTCIEDREPHLKKLSNNGDGRFSCELLYNENKPYIEAIRNHLMTNVFELDFGFVEELNALYLKKKMHLTKSEITKLQKKHPKL